MTEQSHPESLRERLLAERASLLETSEARREANRTVELDQTRTGRLSRMDALQGQAMARAGQQRAAQRLRRIDEALARMDAGEYGDCLECGEPIAAGRLRADPAARLCLRCAEAEENTGG